MTPKRAFTPVFAGYVATFRRRFLKEIEALFVRVLEVAREMGLLKLGTVALDGTKIHDQPDRRGFAYHAGGQLGRASIVDSAKHGTAQFRAVLYPAGRMS
jgi:hypothetical protein